MVELREVEFAYRQGFRLRVNALDLAPGRTLALVGPSGSGKTTLLHLIAGILAPAQGTVRVAGHTLSSMSEAKRRRFRVTQVGMVFQEPRLLDHLDLLTNILLPFHIHPALRLDRAARERAQALARGCGLGDRLSYKPARLSQGERQRAAVCRALVTRAPLLLADEPTSSLDEANARAVLDALLAHVRQEGGTLIALTHDRGSLDRFDRVVDVRSLAGGPVAAAP